MQKRGFAVAGPMAWNDLPAATRVSIARNSNSLKNHDQDSLVQYSNEVTIRNNFRTVHRAPEKTLKGALTTKVLITYDYNASIITLQCITIIMQPAFMRYNIKLICYFQTML